MTGSSSSGSFNPWDWNIKLRQALSADFDDDTLRRMSAALGLDWDALPGGDRQAKARSLIEAAARANRVGDLIAAGRRERPNEPWDAIADGARRFPLTLPPAPPASRPAATPVPPATSPAPTLSAPPPSASAPPPTAPSADVAGTFERRGGSRELYVILSAIGLILIVAAVACVAVNSLWGSLTARVGDGAASESAIVSPPKPGESNAPPVILTAMAVAGATAIAKYGTPPSRPGAAAYPSSAPTKPAGGPLAGFTAILTDTEGRQHRVAANSLRWQSMNEILLDGDRSIPLNTVRAIEVTSNEPTTELKITLDDGSTVVGRPSGGCGFAGETAIGPLQLSCSKLKGVEMTSAGGAVTPIATRAVKGAQAVITDAQGRPTTVRADTLRWSGIDEIWLDGGQTVRFDKIRAIDASTNGSTSHLAMTLTNGETVEGDVGGSCRFGAQSAFGPFELVCDRLKRIEIRDASAGPAPTPVAGRSLKGLTAVVTDTQGKETRGPADSLRWRGIAEVWLDSGQTLTFDKVRAIEVSGDQSAARMKITLVNGAALEDAITGGCWFNIQAGADVTLRCDQIRRIDIQ